MEFWRACCPSRKSHPTEFTPPFGAETILDNLRVADKRQAVDFRVPGVDSKTVAEWIVSNVRFDRLYFYGGDRPIHVSVGPDESGQIVLMLAGPSGRRIPRMLSTERFLGGNVQVADKP